MMHMTLVFWLLLAIGEPDPSYKILAAPGNTYGYAIYLHGRLLIHQTSIPGLPGRKGFARKKDAEKVAGLVIKKLQDHILPPSVSRAEMDSLHVKF